MASLLVWGCLAAGGAAAGPWPRTPGEVFIAQSREIRETGNWDAVYAEFGVSDTTTIMLDTGRGGDGGWHAIAGLRRPLWTFGPHRFAVSLGVGVQRPGLHDLPEEPPLSSLGLVGLAPFESTVYPAAQVGLSWGAGFETRFGNGWSMIDATLRQMFDIDREEHKVDATLGLNLRETRAVFGQIQYSDPRIRDPQVRLGVGWVEHFGPVGIEAGLGKRMHAGGEADAKIGLWLTF